MTTITVIARATVEQINAEHHACERAYDDAVAHAFRAGELLLEVKTQLRHGEFGPWLEDHFEGSDRVARKYMQLAGAPQFSNRHDHAELPRTLDSALEQIARPKPVRVDRGELDNLLAAQDLGDDEPEDPAPASQSADADARRARRVRDKWVEIGVQVDALERADLSRWAKRDAAKSAGVLARQFLAMVDELALSLER